MTTFTKEQLALILSDMGQPLYYQNLAAFALSLMEERDEARAIMESWGCPAETRICLNCGRETPCMTEADLRPGDPGTPCTFDKTYPEMVDYLHWFEDRLREARRELGLVLFNANRVLWLLNEHGASIIPHLMDDDDNPGEEIRRAVRRARERAK